MGKAEAGRIAARKTAEPTQRIPEAAREAESERVLFLESKLIVHQIAAHEKAALQDAAKTARLRGSPHRKKLPSRRLNLRLSALSSSRADFPWTRSPHIKSLAFRRLLGKLRKSGAQMITPKMITPKDGVSLVISKVTLLTSVAKS